MRITLALIAGAFLFGTLGASALSTTAPQADGSKVLVQDKKEKKKKEEPFKPKEKGAY